jgi:Rho-binding antiterminator
MSADPSYRPLECGLHDRLESLATLGRQVRIRYLAGRSEAETSDRIVDVFARDGAEYVRLASGPEIRLDRLRTVDGVVFDQDG